MKNQDYTGAWRCFVDPGDVCGAALVSPGQNAQYPPQALSLSFGLPVLQSIASDTVTPGAALLHDWQPFGVRALNPDWSSGAVSPTIAHRTWAYILQTHTFATGDLGTQQNVLVIESESIADGSCRSGFAGGEVLERFMYVRGFGNVYQEGRINSACQAAHTAADCNGTYAQLGGGGVAQWTLKSSGDYQFSSNHPPSYNVVDWW